MARTSFLLTHDVSDLCIGKPALRWLPPTSTVAEAVAELDAHGPDAAVAVWDGLAKGAGVVGRVRMADVVLFLCADDDNLASPAAALQATLADLLAAVGAGAGAPPVRRVEPHASVLEAVDALLGGAQCLVVPIRRRRASSWTGGEATCMCWLTVEDVVRFFLGSVALFSPTASRSVSDLGVVRPARALSVAATDDAFSAVVRAALATHPSVAVVSGGGRLECEISRSALSSLDAPVAAAALAALSAGELASFVDRGPAHQEAALRVVRSRLHRRSLLGMLDLLDGNDPPSPSSSFSSSSSSSSFSSSSEDDDEGGNGEPPHRTRQAGNHGLMSARWAKGVGRAAREPIACRRGSSLVAVMAQAVSHCVSQVWVVDDVDEKQELVGVVGFLDVLRVLRRHLPDTPPARV